MFCGAKMAFLAPQSWRQRSPSGRPSAEMWRSMMSESARGSENVRFSLRLSPEARQSIEEILRLSDATTVGEAVRRAIGTELFLLQARKRGAKILLREESGSYTEIVLR